MKLIERPRSNTAVGCSGNHGKQLADDRSKIPGPCGAGYQVLNRFCHDLENSRIAIGPNMSWLSWFPGRSPLRIFISYRQADSETEAAAIAAILSMKLGKEHVFFDGDLPKGKDWLSVLKSELYRATAVFAVIGKSWLTVRHSKTNELRLSRPDDVLRQELEIALARGIPVVPILIQGVTEIPKPEDLPPSLNDFNFSRKQAYHVKSITALQHDIDWLIARLRQDTLQDEWKQLRERLRDLSFAMLWLIVIISPLIMLAWLMPWGVAGAMAGLALTVLSLWAPRWWYSKIYRLIKETRFADVPYGWWKAYRELLKCMLQSWGAPSVEMVARVRIEVALLNPEPSVPSPNRDPEVARKESEEWRESRDQLRRLVDSTVRQTLDAVTANINEPPLLNVATCFQLNNAAHGVNRYLNLTQLLFPKLEPASIVSATPIDQHASTGEQILDKEETADATRPALQLPNDEFYCRVRVGQGFLAPQHLIAGMQDHYDEDWRPVLNWYGRAVLDKAEATPEKIRKVQVFQFLCWLMWGPSIPHCTCSQWRTSGDRSSHELVFQFGYGDEGNSWPLCHDGSRGSPLRQFLADELRKFPAARAFQCRVTVKPAAASRIVEKVCPAQRDAIEGADLALRLLNVDSFTGTENKESRRIFQAYVWVMFVLCGPDGQPIFPDEPWKGLVPFFVHGNIAEAETFRFVRHQVVTIAMNSLRELIHDAHDITFRYACASDDGNCRSPLEFEPARPTMAEVLRQSLTQDDLQRILVPSDLEDSSFASVYAACHLPNLVRDFYNSLPQFNETDEDQGDEFRNVAAKDS